MSVNAQVLRLKKQLEDSERRQRESAKVGHYDILCHEFMKDITFKLKRILAFFLFHFCFPRKAKTPKSFRVRHIRRWFLEIPYQSLCKHVLSTYCGSFTSSGRDDKCIKRDWS